MSVGRLYLSSVVKSGNRNLLNRVRNDLFYKKAGATDRNTEVDMLEFVQRHVLSYRQLPTKQVIESAGFQYLETDQPPEYYLEELKKRAVFNAFKDFATKIDPVIKQKFDLDLAVDYIAEFAKQVSFLSVADKFKTIQEIGGEIQTQIELRKDGKPEIFIPFGWKTMDEMTGGATGGDLVYGVARTGVGKSSTLCKNALSAWQAGFSPLVLTMEMTDIQLSRRLYGLAGGFNPNAIRKGIPDNHVEQRLASAIQTFENGPAFHIMCGQTRQTVEKITSMVDELRPDALYIDAAYLVSVNGSSAKMWEKLAMVGERLKELAISRDIPILQTVQFNRESVKTKTFDLSTIGGSDTIGQLASIAYAITEAEEPYNETRRNVALIKNREGSVADFDINYTFDPPNFDEITVGEQHNAEDEVVLI